MEEMEKKLKELGLETRLFLEEGRKVLAVKPSSGKIFIVTETQLGGIDHGISPRTYYSIRAEGENVLPYAKEDDVIKYFSKTIQESMGEPNGKECPSCGGPLHDLGSLGSANYSRCRNCGMETSDTDRFDIDESDSMEISEEDLKNYVKETLFNSFQEHDLVAPDVGEWKDQSKSLKIIMVDLLKHIEDDEYLQGLGKIDKAMMMLRTWKYKIEKHLRN
jgi:hypothetical protein